LFYDSDLTPFVIIGCVLVNFLAKGC